MLHRNERIDPQLLCCGHKHAVNRLIESENQVNRVSARMLSSFEYDEDWRSADKTIAPGSQHS
jgi:hypothetical protein